MNINKKLNAIIWTAVSTPEQAADDKESLSAQETDLHAIAQQYGWHVLEVLQVPGFSRDYLSVEEWVADSAAQGIEAPRKLLNVYMDYPKHRRPKFDVFLCRDADRFGRTQSLLTYIAEAILVKMELLIYSQRDGLIDLPKARMFISMAGYRSAGYVDDLKHKHEFGMRRRAERGLLVSSRNPLSHRTIRNQVGQAVSTEVREDLRRLWDDLATVILEGVSWWEIERVLFARYGHARPNGTRHTDTFFYRLVHNPVFWGHNPQGMYTPDRKRDAQLFGPWVYDEDEPLPEGVTIHRNIFGAVWEGELATRIKAELRRRHDIVIGSARPYNTSALSGILVCAECGRGMTAHKVNGFQYYRCNTNRLRNRRDWPKCPSKHYIKYETVRDYLTPRLEQARASGNYDIAHEDVHLNGVQQLEQLEREIANAERELGQFILDKVRSKAPDVYERLIADTETHLVALRNRMQNIRRDEQYQKRVSRSQASAIIQLQDLGVPGLWEQSPRVINQLLNAILGGNALVVLDGQIIKIAKPMRKRMSRE